jgi:4'-phosphopantetheinyl transferase
MPLGKQHLQLATQEFLRSVLSQYAGMKPQDIVFGYEVYGRPFVSNVLGDLPCFFSLTHTDGLWVCAVAKFASVGVDAESLGRKIPSAAFMQHHFTAREYAQMCATIAAQKNSQFLKYWTLKEAYLKARGLGLYGAPNSIELRMHVHNAVDGNVLDASDPAPLQWRFQMLQISSKHVVSLALNHAKVRQHKVRLFEWAKPT